MIDFPFISSFTDNKEILAKNYPHTYPKNPYFKTDDFQQKHQYAWFQLYLTFIQTLQTPLFNDLVAPEDIRIRTQEHIESSNDFLQELQEIIKLEEMTDDNKNKVLKVKDVFEKLKTTHFYQSLSKSEQRTYNLRYLREKLSSKLPYKAHYKERHGQIRSVLTYASMNITSDDRDWET